MEYNSAALPPAPEEVDGRLNRRDGPQPEEGTTSVHDTVNVSQAEKAEVDVLGGSVLFATALQSSFSIAPRQLSDTVAEGRGYGLTGNYDPTETFSVRRNLFS